MAPTGTITLYDRNTAHPGEVPPGLEAVYWDYDNQVLIVKNGNEEVRSTPESLIDRAHKWLEPARAVADDTRKEQTVGVAYLNLDPKYTQEEIDRATFRLGNSMGGIHGFEFTHQNVTEELEKMRAEENERHSAMDPEKQRRLEEAGWKVGTVQELLGLTDEDVEVIELRLVNRDLWEGLRKALDERDQAQAGIAALRKYVRHRPACRALPPAYEPCNCGWDAVQEQAGR